MCHTLPSLIIFLFPWLLQKGVEHHCIKLLGFLIGFLHVCYMKGPNAIVSSSYLRFLVVCLCFCYKKASMPLFSFLWLHFFVFVFLTFFPPLCLSLHFFPSFYLSMSLCLSTFLYLSLSLLISQFQASLDVSAHIYHHCKLALQKPPFMYAITISWRSKNHYSHLPSL